MNTSGSDAWVYAEAVTQYGGPYVLAGEADSAVHLAGLASHSRAFTAKVGDWLTERQKAVTSRADSEDFLRGRNDR